MSEQKLIEVPQVNIDDLLSLMAVPRAITKRKNIFYDRYCKKGKALLNGHIERINVKNAVQGVFFLDGDDSPTWRLFRLINYSYDSLKKDDFDNILSEFKSFYESYKKELAKNPDLIEEMKKPEYYSYSRSHFSKICRPLNDMLTDTKILTTYLSPLFDFEQNWGRIEEKLKTNGKIDITEPPFSFKREYIEENIKNILENLKLHSNNTGNVRSLFSEFMPQDYRPKHPLLERDVAILNYCISNMVEGFNENIGLYAKQLEQRLIDVLPRVEIISTQLSSSMDELAHAFSEDAKDAFHSHFGFKKMIDQYRYKR